MTHTWYYDAPLGGILLAAEGDALTGLWWEGQKYAGSTIAGESVEEVVPVIRQAMDWLDSYFDGKRLEARPKMLLRGTEFQQCVWRQLLRLPYGEVTTYGALAEALAGEGDWKRPSARAVGSAVGRNPISIIVPCHRVVGADGGLTGYAGGMERKIRLLRLEGVEVDTERKRVILK